jgi:HSP20 family protein
MTENTMSMELEKQDVESPTTVERTRPRRTFVPRVDIYETDDQVVLLADMPGVTENSIDITLEKNILTVRGEVELSIPDEYELAYAEYYIGDYERTFALSDEVDRTKIEASIKNGVLRLVLPKDDAAKTRKIAVRAEA